MKHTIFKSSVFTLVLVGFVACGGMKVSMAPDANAQEMGDEDASAPSSTTAPTNTSATESCACERGATGEQGPAGEAGPMGPQGPKGADGAVGTAGKTGSPGAPGAVGAKGDPGNAGPQGEQGPMGLQGERGAKGEAGAAGAVGAKGDKGDKGDRGAVGPAGSINAGSVYRASTTNTDWALSMGGDDVYYDFPYASCDEGDVMLGGGCTGKTSDSNVSNFSTLLSNGPSTNAYGDWVCEVSNLTGQYVTLTATVICLDVDGNH